MTFKVLQLSVICLVMIEALAREDQPSHNAAQANKQTHSGVRRPDEYLQPPPVLRVLTPTAQRRAPTRLRSIRINGRHSSPQPTANARHTSSPLSGNSLQMHSTSGRASSVYSSSGRYSPRGNTPPSSSTDRHIPGPTGNPISDETSASSGQRISRWFLSSYDSEVQGERKPDMNKILRPPPPPHREHSSPPNYQPVQSSIDQTASGTHQQHSVVPYRASPHQKSKTTQCNPCNKIPWIPMVTAHHGPSDAGNGHAPSPNTYLPPAPLPSQYESPSVGSLPLQSHDTEYGPPLPPLESPDQYGPPPPSKSTDGQYALRPLSSIHPGTKYGPPHKQTDGYGLPLLLSQHIQSEYKPPPLTISPHPGNEYGPPHKLTDEYGPPSPPPQHIQPEYKPPPLTISPHPGNEYGPPHKLTDEYGPPPPPPQHIQPEYKPPPLTISSYPGTKYGPPHKLTDEYGPPPPLPQQTHLQFQPSPLPASQNQGIEYGPPLSTTLNKPEYGPPILSQPPRTEYGTPSHSPEPDYRPPSPPADQYGEPQHDAIKQQSSPQLAPVYLPAPPVYEPEWFKVESQSAASHYKVPSPNSGSNNAFNHGQNYHSTGHSSGERGHGGESGQSDIDVVQSVSLIDDSHPVASQHPATSSSHDSSFFNEFSSHLVPNASHHSNNQFHLPSGENFQPQEYKDQLHNIPLRNESQEPSLEVIPSVQVKDYVSSIEYPLQIVQSPYIDVTEPPGHGVKQIAENQNYDSHASAHPSNSYGEGEIIIGKPALAASKLNSTNTQNSYSAVGTGTQNSVSDIHDQRQQQSVIHETNFLEHTNGGPPVLDQPPSSAVKPSSPDNAYFGSDDQIKHPAEGINVSGEHVIKQGSSLNKEHSSTDFEIQPSIQTSAEGNSLIHQINNAFQSDIGPTAAPPSQHTFQKSHSSDYVLFQNFPEPPLNSLPANVLKQQLPPPTPFQSTFQQNPYLPPQTSTNPFEHALKLEATASFLSPPPKNNGEYSTVTNTATPDYTFWTPTSRPHSLSLSPVKEDNSWGSATTQKPLEKYNQDVIAAFAEAAGLLPPPPSLCEPLDQSNKKTKQIQIIVPYTSSKELMQFKFQDTSKPIFDTTGWLPITGSEDVKQQGRKAPSLQVNCSDERSWQQCKNTTALPWQEQNDYHQHQESRTVEATAPVLQTDKEITRSYPYKNNSEIQHMFAANIRDVLRGEEDINVPDYITLQRLQKNIDEWTALEYSKWKDLDRFNTTKNLDGGSKSTTAPTSSVTLFQRLFVPSKKIPEEYLTTTPSLFDDVTSTENFVATAIPSFKKSRSSTTTSTTAPYSGSYTRTVPLASSDERDYTPKINHDLPLNHQRKGDNRKWKIIESNYIIPEALAVTTKGTTADTMPQTTATPLSEEVTNTDLTTWDQIPLSISPVTNEKVYVVTPMTNWIPDSTTPTPYQTSPYSTKTRSTSINDVFPFRNGPPSVQKLVASAPFSFKSPRFIIRPTPATNVHRSYTLAFMEDDNEDNWNGVKTTTSKPVKLNRIDGNTDFEHNSTVQETTTSNPKTIKEHLLLGLSILPTYMPPIGTRVQTDSGHSKVVNVVNTATVVPSTWKKQSKKQSTVATTKLFPVISLEPTRSTEPLPKQKGGISKESASTLTPRRSSYLWQFPDLSGHLLMGEDLDEVQDAVLELKKERSS